MPKQPRRINQLDTSTGQIDESGISKKFENEIDIQDLGIDLSTLQNAQGNTEGGHISPERIGMDPDYQRATDSGLGAEDNAAVAVRNQGTGDRFLRSIGRGSAKGLSGLLASTGLDSAVGAFVGVFDEASGQYIRHAEEQFQDYLDTNFQVHESAPENLWDKLTSWNVLESATSSAVQFGFSGMGIGFATARAAKLMGSFGVELNAIAKANALGKSTARGFVKTAQFMAKDYRLPAQILGKRMGGLTGSITSRGLVNGLAMGAYEGKVMSEETSKNLESQYADKLLDPTVSDEEKAKIRQEIDSAGSQVFWQNFLVSFTDMVGMSKFLEFGKANNKNFFNFMLTDAGIKAGGAEGVQEVLQSVIQSDAQFQAQQDIEAKMLKSDIESTTAVEARQEMLRKYAQANGLPFLKDSSPEDYDKNLSLVGKNFAERVIEHATSDEAIVEGFAGVIGGPIQWGVTKWPGARGRYKAAQQREASEKSLEKYTTDVMSALSSDQFKNEAKLATLLEDLDAMRTPDGKKLTDTADGKVLKDAVSDYMAEKIALTAIRDGNYDKMREIVNTMISDANKSNLSGTEKQELRDRANSIYSYLSQYRNLENAENTEKQISDKLNKAALKASKKLMNFSEAQDFKAPEEVDIDDTEQSDDASQEVLGSAKQGFKITAKAKPTTKKTQTNVIIDPTVEEILTIAPPQDFKRAVAATEDSVEGAQEISEFGTSVIEAMVSGLNSSIDASKDFVIQVPGSDPVSISEVLKAVRAGQNAADASDVEFSLESVLDNFFNYDDTNLEGFTTQNDYFAIGKMFLDTARDLGVKTTKAGYQRVFESMFGVEQKDGGTQKDDAATDDGVTGDASSDKKSDPDSSSETKQKKVPNKPLDELAVNYSQAFNDEIAAIDTTQDDWRDQWFEAVTNYEKGLEEQDRINSSSETQAYLYGVRQRERKLETKLNKAIKRKALHTLDGLIRELQSQLENLDDRLASNMTYVGLLSRAVKARKEITDAGNSATKKTPGSTVKEDTDVSSKKSEDTIQAEIKLNEDLEKSKKARPISVEEAPGLADGLRSITEALDQIDTGDEVGLNDRRKKRIKKKVDLPSFAKPDQKTPKTTAENVNPDTNRKAAEQQTNDEEALAAEVAQEAKEASQVPELSKTVSGANQAVNIGLLKGVLQIVDAIAAMQNIPSEQVIITTDMITNLLASQGKQLNKSQIMALDNVIAGLTEVNHDSIPSGTSKTKSEQKIEVSDDKAFNLFSKAKSAEESNIQRTTASFNLSDDSILWPTGVEDLSDYDEFSEGAELSLIPITTENEGDFVENILVTVDTEAGTTENMSLKAFESLDATDGINNFSYQTRDNLVPIAVVKRGDEGNNIVGWVRTPRHALTYTREGVEDPTLKDIAAKIESFRARILKNAAKKGYADASITRRAKNIQKTEDGNVSGAALAKDSKAVRNKEANRTEDVFGRDSRIAYGIVENDGVDLAKVMESLPANAEIAIPEELNEMTGAMLAFVPVDSSNIYKATLLNTNRIKTEEFSSIIRILTQYMDSVRGNQDNNRVNDFTLNRITASAADQIDGNPAVQSTAFPNNLKNTLETFVNLHTPINPNTVYDNKTVMSMSDVNIKKSRTNSQEKLGDREVEVITPSFSIGVANGGTQFKVFYEYGRATDQENGTGVTTAIESGGNAINLYSIANMRLENGALVPAIIVRDAVSGQERQATKQEYQDFLLSINSKNEQPYQHIRSAAVYASQSSSGQSSGVAVPTTIKPSESSKQREISRIQGDYKSEVIGRRTGTDLRVGKRMPDGTYNYAVNTRVSIGLDTELSAEAKQAKKDRRANKTKGKEVAENTGASQQSTNPNTKSKAPEAKGVVQTTYINTSDTEYNSENKPPELNSRNKAVKFRAYTSMTEYVTEINKRLQSNTNKDILARLTALKEVAELYLNVVGEQIAEKDMYVVNQSFMNTMRVGTKKALSPVTNSIAAQETKEQKEADNADSVPEAQNKVNTEDTSTSTSDENITRRRRRRNSNKLKSATNRTLPNGEFNPSTVESDNTDNDSYENQHDNVDNDMETLNSSTSSTQGPVKIEVNKEVVRDTLSVQVIPLVDSIAFRDRARDFKNNKFTIRYQAEDSGQIGADTLTVDSIKTNAKGFITEVTFMDSEGVKTTTKNLNGIMVAEDLYRFDNYKNFIVPALSNTQGDLSLDGANIANITQRTFEAEEGMRVAKQENDEVVRTLVEESLEQYQYVVGKEKLEGAEETSLIEQISGIVKELISAENSESITAAQRVEINKEASRQYKQSLANMIAYLNRYLMLEGTTKNDRLKASQLMEVYKKMYSSPNAYYVIEGSAKAFFDSGYMSSSKTSQAVEEVDEDEDSTEERRWGGKAFNDSEIDPRQGLAKLARSKFGMMFQYKLVTKDDDQEVLQPVTGILGRPQYMDLDTAYLRTVNLFGNKNIIGLKGKVEFLQNMVNDIQAEPYLYARMMFLLDFAKNMEGNGYTEQEKLSINTALNKVPNKAVTLGVIDGDKGGRKLQPKDNAFSSGYEKFMNKIRTVVNFASTSNSINTLGALGEEASEVLASTKETVIAALRKAVRPALNEPKNETISKIFSKTGIPKIVGDLQKGVFAYLTESSKDSNDITEFLQDENAWKDYSLSSLVDFLSTISAKSYEKKIYQGIIDTNGISLKDKEAVKQAKKFANDIVTEILPSSLAYEISGRIAQIFQATTDEKLPPGVQDKLAIDLMENITIPTYSIKGNQGGTATISSMVKGMSQDFLGFKNTKIGSTTLSQATNSVIAYLTESTGLPPNAVSRVGTKMLANFIDPPYVYLRAMRLRDSEYKSRLSRTVFSRNSLYMELMNKAADAGLSWVSNLFNIPEKGGLKSTFMSSVETSDSKFASMIYHIGNYLSSVDFGYLPEGRNNMVSSGNAYTTIDERRGGKIRARGAKFGMITSSNNDYAAMFNGVDFDAAQMKIMYGPEGDAYYPLEDGKPVVEFAPQYIEYWADKAVASELDRVFNLANKQVQSSGYNSNIIYTIKSLNNIKLGEDQKTLVEIIQDIQLNSPLTEKISTMNDVYSKITDVNVRNSLRSLVYAAAKDDLVSSAQETIDYMVEVGVLKKVNNQLVVADSLHDIEDLKNLMPKDAAISKDPLVVLSSTLSTVQKYQLNFERYKNDFASENTLDSIMGPTDVNSAIFKEIFQEFKDDEAYKNVSDETITALVKAEMVGYLIASTNGNVRVLETIIGDSHESTKSIMNLVKRNSRLNLDTAANFDHYLANIVDEDNPGNLSKSQIKSIEKRYDTIVKQFKTTMKTAEELVGSDSNTKIPYASIFNASLGEQRVKLDAAASKEGGESTAIAELKESLSPFYKDGNVYLDVEIDYNLSGEERRKKLSKKYNKKLGVKDDSIIRSVMYNYTYGYKMSVLNQFQLMYEDMATFYKQSKKNRGLDNMFSDGYDIVADIETTLDNIGKRMNMFTSSGTVGDNSMKYIALVAKDVEVDSEQIPSFKNIDANDAGAKSTPLHHAHYLASRGELPIAAIPHLVSWYEGNISEEKFMEITGIRDTSDLVMGATKPRGVDTVKLEVRDADGNITEDEVYGNTYQKLGKSISTKKLNGTDPNTMSGKSLYLLKLFENNKELNPEGLPVMIYPESAIKTSSNSNVIDLSKVSINENADIDNLQISDVTMGNLQFDTSFIREHAYDTLAKQQSSKYKKEKREAIKTSGQLVDEMFNAIPLDYTATIEGKSQNITDLWHKTTDDIIAQGSKLFLYAINNTSNSVDDIYKMLKSAPSEILADFMGTVSTTASDKQLAKVIKASMKMQAGYDPNMVNPNIEAYLDVDEKGNFIHDIRSSGNFEQYLDQIRTMLERKTVKSTRKGFYTAVVPDTDFNFDTDVTNTKRSEVYFVNKDSKGEDTTLFRNRDGSYSLKAQKPGQKAQLIVPWQEFYIDSQGERIDMVMEEYMLKDENGKPTGTIDVQSLPKGFLDAVMYRTPNQDYNMMGSAEIAGFFPANVKNQIVGPKEWVSQMGQDFDIDKLFGYRKHLTLVTDKNGNESVKVIDQDVAEQNPKLRYYYLQNLQQQIIETILSDENIVENYINKPLIGEKEFMEDNFFNTTRENGQNVFTNTADKLQPRVKPKSYEKSSVTSPSFQWTKRDNAAEADSSIGVFAILNRKYAQFKGRGIALLGKKKGKKKGNALEIKKSIALGDMTATSLGEKRSPIFMSKKELEQKYPSTRIVGGKEVGYDDVVDAPLTETHPWKSAELRQLALDMHDIPQNISALISMSVDAENLQVLYKLGINDRTYTTISSMLFVGGGFRLSTILAMINNPIFLDKGGVEAFTDFAEEILANKYDLASDEYKDELDTDKFSYLIRETDAKGNKVPIDELVLGKQLMDYGDRLRVLKNNKPTLENPYTQQDYDMLLDGLRLATFVSEARQAFNAYKVYNPLINPDSKGIVRDLTDVFKVNSHISMDHSADNPEASKPKTQEQLLWSEISKIPQMRRAAGVYRTYVDVITPYLSSATSDAVISILGDSNVRTASLYKIDSKIRAKVYNQYRPNLKSLANRLQTVLQSTDPDVVRWRANNSFLNKIMVTAKGFITFNNEGSSDTPVNIIRAFEAVKKSGTIAGVDMAVLHEDLVLYSITSDMNSFSQSYFKYIDPYYKTELLAQKMGKIKTKKRLSAKDMLEKSKVDPLELAAIIAFEHRADLPKATNRIMEHTAASPAPMSFRNKLYSLPASQDEDNGPRIVSIDVNGVPQIWDKRSLRKFFMQTGQDKIQAILSSNHILFKGHESKVSALDETPTGGTRLMQGTSGMTGRRSSSDLYQDVDKTPDLSKVNADNEVEVDMPQSVLFSITERVFNPKTAAALKTFVRALVPSKTKLRIGLDPNDRGGSWLSKSEILKLSGSDLADLDQGLIVHEVTHAALSKFIANNYYNANKVEVPTANISSRNVKKALVAQASAIINNIDQNRKNIIGIVTQAMQEIPTIFSEYLEESDYISVADLSSVNDSLLADFSTKNLAKAVLNIGTAQLINTERGTMVDKDGNVKTLLSNNSESVVALYEDLTGNKLLRDANGAPKNNLTSHQVAEILTKIAEGGLTQEISDLGVPTTNVFMTNAENNTVGYALNNGDKEFSDLFVGTLQAISKGSRKVANHEISVYKKAVEEADVDAQNEYIEIYGNTTDPDVVYKTVLTNQFTDLIEDKTNVENEAELIYGLANLHEFTSQAQEFGVSKTKSVGKTRRRMKGYEKFKNVSSAYEGTTSVDQYISQADNVLNHFTNTDFVSDLNKADVIRRNFLEATDSIEEIINKVSKTDKTKNPLYKDVALTKMLVNWDTFFTETSGESQGTVQWMSTDITEELLKC